MATQDLLLRVESTLFLLSLAPDPAGPRPIPLPSFRKVQLVQTGGVQGRVALVVANKLTVVDPADFLKAAVSILFLDANEVGDLRIGLFRLDVPTWLLKTRLPKTLRIRINESPVPRQSPVPPHQERRGTSTHIHPGKR